MARFVSPITDMKSNGSLRFFKSGTNTVLVTFKDELETIANPIIVPVLPNGNVQNIFYQGSARVLYLDEFDVQYAERDPVGDEVGIGNFTNWVETVIYDENDITKGSDGRFYLSLSNGNQGNDPTLTPTSWEEIRFIGVWNTNITYSIGEVVQINNGILYRALTATAGNDPSADDGTNWAPQGESIIATPVNVTPSASAVDVSSTPTLVGSAFSGGTDVHVHSRWQIATDIGFTMIVYDSGTSDDLESHTVPTADKLDGEIVHYWRVRYFGVNGVSDFSTGTSFTTEAAFSSLFATTLYTGNGTSQGIISGLDFVAGDGLVWIKARTQAAPRSHILTDTLRGAGEYLSSDSTAAEVTQIAALSAFNNDGFDVGSLNDVNDGGNSYVAWQWIKQQGFFDVVTYVGDGIVHDVPHSLGHDVGLIIVKSLSTANWQVLANNLTTPLALRLNQTSAAENPATFASTWVQSATSTDFTVGTLPDINTLNDNYIAYLFAHNPSKGIFCGSYTGTGAVGNAVVTGFPVGWVLIKRTDTANDWNIVDIKRSSGADMDSFLEPNTTDIEGSATPYIASDSNGFTVNTTFTAVNTAGGNYIFMALADPLQF